MGKMIPVEFDGFRKQGGLNSITLTATLRYEGREPCDTSHRTYWTYAHANPN